MIFQNYLTLYSQNVDDDFIAGKWMIEEIIVPEDKYTDKKEKKLLEELHKTILHFSGDGHFYFIYNDEYQGLKRSIADFQNSIWRTIKDENKISIEKQESLALITIDLDEKIIFGFIEHINFQVKKIQNEKVNFLPLTKKPLDEKTIVERKIDSVFRQVKIDEENLENTVVSKYPIIEGCENLKSDNQSRNCMNKFIQKHILDKLELKKYKSLVDSLRLKVYLNFVIDKDGIIKNINIKSPDDTLSFDLKLIINNIEVIRPALDDKNQRVLARFKLPLTLLIQ